MLIRIPKGWEISERFAIPERVYLNRREFLKQLGAGGAGLIFGCASESGKNSRKLTVPRESGLSVNVYPAKRNLKFSLDRPLTDEKVAGSYNNFYEFTKAKDQVRYLVNRFKVRPWSVEVKGLVENPGVFDPDDLVQKMPLEERLYRFRCVEAWAMAVPWTGFPFKAMIDQVKPKSTAKYIRMVSFNRPEQALGQNKQPWLPWPYFEGLTIEEAMNELAFLATGIYGHELPKQHGAPIRLVVPWKYGYKSIKSIVLIEFIGEQPRTFWNQIAPENMIFCRT